MKINIVKNGEVVDKLEFYKLFFSLIDKDPISFWNVDAYAYDRAYLQEPDKEEFSIEFLKLLNKIDDNLEDSYLQEKYGNAFYNLVNRYVSGHLIKAKESRKDGVKVSSDDYDPLALVDLEIAIKPVSKELFVGLVKLNNKLIKTNKHALGPIETSDEAFIKESNSEMPDFPNMNLEDWAGWFKIKNQKTEDESVSDQEKNNGMER